MAGEQTSRTHTLQELRQLVVLVRPCKPATNPLNDKMATADSMVSKVTDKVDSAASAAENAMASIPGLDMLIKENKKQFQSDDKYTYYDDYSPWDQMMNNLKDGLTDLQDDNDTITFEYKASNSDELINEAKKLATQIKNKMVSWKKLDACVHFIGLDNGGNIANECTKIFADDNDFKSQQGWHVGAVIYVATSLTKDHLLNEAALKSKGSVFSFANRYDLTALAVNYFQPGDKLIQNIKDSNKNELSFLIGTIKIHIVKALAILLDGLHIGTGAGGQSPDQMFNGVKNEIEEGVKTLVNNIKQLAQEGIGVIKPGKLPQFGQMLKGYDQIPGKCVKELETYFKDFKNSLGDRAKSIVGMGSRDSGGFGIEDLANLLNCLCPLFDTLTQSLKHFSYSEEGSKELSEQIISSCDIKTVSKPLSISAKWMDVDTDLIQGATHAAQAGKPDETVALINKIQNNLSKATANSNIVKKMSDDEKKQLAEAIYNMMTPMLPSKFDFYKRLISALPFNLDELTKNISGNVALQKLSGALGKFEIKTPAKLQASVDAFDTEFKRITGYLNKNKFHTQEKANSLYLIYNSHNKTLANPYGYVKGCIESVTGIMDHKSQQGMDNNTNIDDSSYNPTGGGIKQNVQSAKEMQDAAT